MQSVENHTVDFILALLLLIGSSLGAQFGTRIGRKLKADQLKILLATLVLVVMATIAREQRVPALVNTEDATSLLRNGDEITLDATENVVYRGRIVELDRFERTEADMFEESYEYRLLRRLLKRIAPLNLVDPHSEEFKPQACRTYHDITRFIHEKAVEALVVLSQRHKALHHAPARRLVDGPPLGLTVIDAGGGVNCPPQAATMTMDQLASVPLLAFLEGLTVSGMS